MWGIMSAWKVWKWGTNSLNISYKCSPEISTSSAHKKYQLEVIISWDQNRLDENAQLKMSTNLWIKIADGQP